MDPDSFSSSWALLILIVRIDRSNPASRLPSRRPIVQFQHDASEETRNLLSLGHPKVPQLVETLRHPTGELHRSEMALLGTKLEGETGLGLRGVGGVQPDVAVGREVDSVAEEGVQRVDKLLGLCLEHLTRRFKQVRTN